MARYAHLGLADVNGIWTTLQNTLKPLGVAAAEKLIDGYLIEHDLFPSALRQDRENPYPLGFGDRADFNLFLWKILSHVPHDVQVVMQGSSVSGYSYNDKDSGSRLFDHGRRSDYDVALVSHRLFEAAVSIGVKAKGTVGVDEHTVPLTDADLDRLDLRRARDAAAESTEGWDLARGTAIPAREVNFMIYDSTEGASRHTGPSLLTHHERDDRGKIADYREAQSFMFGSAKF